MIQRMVVGGRCGGLDHIFQLQEREDRDRGWEHCALCHLASTVQYSTVLWHLASPGLVMMRQSDNWDSNLSLAHVAG